MGAVGLGLSALGTRRKAFDYHAYLNNEIEWVYLAPGAYIKGAFQLLTCTSRAAKGA